MMHLMKFILLNVAWMKTMNIKNDYFKGGLI
jgi:hypothetical protein